MIRHPYEFGCPSVAWIYGRSKLPGCGSLSAVRRRLKLARIRRLTLEMPSVHARHCWGVGGLHCYGSCDWRVGSAGLLEGLSGPPRRVSRFQSGSRWGAPLVRPSHVGFISEPHLRDTASLGDLRASRSLVGRDLVVS